MKQLRSTRLQIYRDTEPEKTGKPRNYHAALHT
jgi:hypothetical protein